MNYSTYRFSLDIQSTQSQVSLPVMLGDTARRLYISLTDGGKPYVIAEGCRASLAARKADGKTLLHDCIIEKNTYIRYDFTEQTATALGLTECNILIYGDDGEIIGSPRFSLVVYNDVVGLDVVSEDDLATISRIIAGEHERTAACEAAIADTKEATSRANEIADDLEGKRDTGYYHGITPHIGENGHWWIGDQDTGVRAEGRDGGGFVPYIGENKSWWIAGQDTGVKAEGKDGKNGTTPHIGANGNWWIGNKDTGMGTVSSPFELVDKYTTAGSYEWTCPKDGEYVALIVGGGGSGGLRCTTSTEDYTGITAAGGFPGDCQVYRGQITADTNIPIVVGAGGEGYATTNGSERPGKKGGASSFNSVTANGGDGGGLGTFTSNSNLEIGMQACGWSGMFEFLDENNIPATLHCYGGSIKIYYKDEYTQNIYYSDSALEPIYYGKINSLSQGTTFRHAYSFPMVGIRPSDCGAGSGAMAFLYYSSLPSEFSASIAQGADGGVFIYKVRSRAGGGDNNGGGDDDGSGDDDGGESTIPENILSSGDGYHLTDKNGVYLMPA